jgi:hypothetical protein
MIFRMMIESILCDMRLEVFYFQKTKRNELAKKYLVNHKTAHMSNCCLGFSLINIFIYARIIE